jgi:DhnA family fructose-bisphosphate aldolase class Ia
LLLINQILSKMFGKEIRMNRLFNGGKNAVIVAVDHGMFDGPIPGMINLRETIGKISSVVDGILISPGMLKECGSAFSFKGAPVPIVRINWSDIYCFHWNYNQANTVVACKVEDAVAAGAEMVVISLTIATGNPETDAKNIEVYCRLKNEAEKLGIPVIGELFPAYSYKLNREEMHEKVYSGCRILSELGTDMIKTFYTIDFKKVTESTPVPIFGLGADKKPTQLEALQLAADEIRDGARGVVFGRNAIQVPDPVSFQEALCEVVKNGMTPLDAVAEFNLRD